MNVTGRELDLSFSKPICLRQSATPAPGAVEAVGGDVCAEGEGQRSGAVEKEMARILNQLQGGNLPKFRAQFQL